ncbi:hypothetical protein BpHYR1_042659 [Brachionus plicatilis]|uniref:Uncharacterized protein n=1 Tax=Brachionus plicatilis TaxID=10195 RepID=A0A3M7QEZ8_BRAPC|nr:hypothetical protein BpHYR1_042659 [Brachionus plicatilis]
MFTGKKRTLKERCFSSCMFEFFKFVNCFFQKNSRLVYVEVEGRSLEIFITNEISFEVLLKKPNLYTFYFRVKRYSTFELTN